MRLFEQQRQSDKYKNNIQNQYIYKIEKSDCYTALHWKDITLKRLHQFFATMNVPQDIKKTKFIF